jgi:hypothetical protein
VKVETPTVEGNQDHASGDPIGHGTCAASIACSRIGIMIKGTLVSMKAIDIQGRLTMASISYALSSTLIDIDTKERWGKSVVNIAASCKSIVYTMTFVHANLFYSYASQ